MTAENFWLGVLMLKFKMLCKKIYFVSKIGSFYGRMNEILNGMMFSNMTGGAIFLAVAVQQVEAVCFTLHKISLKNISRFSNSCLCSTGERSSWFESHDKCNCRIHLTICYFSLLLCGYKCFLWYTITKFIDLQNNLV